MQTLSYDYNCIKTESSTVKCFVFLLCLAWFIAVLLAALFGLLDFIIAVSMGMATRTNEWLYFANQASSDIMGQFPLVLIPGFAVPFYIITHLIIYAQLNHR